MVAKGEIAHYEQFLLLSQCFQKSSAAETSENVYMRQMVKNTVDMALKTLRHKEKLLASKKNPMSTTFSKFVCFK